MIIQENEESLFILNGEKYPSVLIFDIGSIKNSLEEFLKSKEEALNTINTFFCSEIALYMTQKYLKVYRIFLSMKNNNELESKNV